MLGGGLVTGGLAGGVEAGAAEGAAEAADSAAADAAETCANSFTADTPVLMADGREVSISEVRIGAKVIATDPQTGQTTVRPVVELIHHSGPHRMVAITLTDGSVLRATDHHRIWDQTRGAFTYADQIHGGDRLLGTRGQMETVKGLRVYEQTLTAYNLQIQGIHTYYAGQTSVLVHNACGGDPDVESKIPDDWVTTSAKKGPGTRYIDPENPARSVRDDGDHVHVHDEGPIGPNGERLNDGGDIRNPARHIPKDVYNAWTYWNRP